MPGKTKDAELKLPVPLKSMEEEKKLLTAATFRSNAVIGFDRSWWIAHSDFGDDSSTRVSFFEMSNLRDAHPANPALNAFCDLERAGGLGMLREGLSSVGGNRRRMSATPLHRLLDDRCITLKDAECIFRCARFLVSRDVPPTLSFPFSTAEPSRDAWWKARSSSPNVHCAAWLKHSLIHVLYCLPIVPV